MTVRCLIQNSEPSSLFLYLIRVALFAATLMLTACQTQNQPTAQAVTFSGPTMGTEYRITIVIPPDWAAKETGESPAKITTDERNQLYTGLEAQVIAELDAVNTSMSTYLDDSELSRFNQVPANTEFSLSPAMQVVMEEALELSELSGGAFDITVADAVRLWGFGPDGVVTEQPSTEQLEALKESVGYKKLSLNGAQLSRQHSNTNVDLSSIAKGFAVDQLARMLEKQGLNDYLVNVGGELRGAGKNIDNKVWSVAIEKPQTLGGIQQIIELQDSAIATSGDYRNYILLDGQKFSHTIDPATLRPVFHKLSLVSVISDKASTADGLATALLVMGEQAALDFASRNELAAYFVVRSDNNDEFEITYTDQFEVYLR